MYRIHQNLTWSNGRELEAGTIDRLEGVSDKVKKVLIDRGVVSEVVAPPLRIVPRFADVAEKYEELGIEDVDDLLEADLDELSDATGTPVDELERDAEDVVRYIS